MITICTSPGELHPMIQTALELGRFSQGHREALLKIAKADPEAAIRGLDYKLRPVVVCNNGGKRVTFAILKNGNHTVPQIPMYEHWRE